MAKPWESRKSTPWELCRGVREESQERDESTAGTICGVADFSNGARWGLWPSCSQVKKDSVLVSLAPVSGHCIKSAFSGA